MDAIEIMSEGAERSFRRRLFTGLQAFSGGFLLYLAVCGLAGIAVERRFTSEPSCFPFNSIFGLLESTCPDAAVNLFWSVTVGWPRFLIVFPALAIAQFKVVVSGGGRHLWDATMWLIYSIPLLLLIWAGIRYWWKRYRAIAPIAAIFVVWETFRLG